MQGLGAGTLAIHADETKEIDFFELDRSVYDIATKYFSFLESSKAKINYIIGDARLSLDQVKDKEYDLIISDVFGGDSIPVHMITREALLKYRKYLGDEGIVLFHISSRCIKPKNVLMKTAASTGAKVCYSKSKHISYYIPSSEWLAVTWDTDIFETLTSDLGWIAEDENSVKNLRVWTDLYSSVIPYMSFDKFFSLK